MTLRFDKLGVVIAAIAAYAAFLAPFATFRANRIAPGQARSILEALPATAGPLLMAIVIVAALMALFRTPLMLRLAASVVALAVATVGPRTPSSTCSQTSAPGTCATWWSRAR